MRQKLIALLEQLRHPEPLQRIHAVRLLLMHIRAEDREAWERVEWMALYDQDPRVRLVALAALLTPEGQRYYALWLPTLTPETYQTRKAQLEQMAQAGGPADPTAVAVLLDFFAQHQPEALPIPEPLPEPMHAPKAQPQPPPTAEVGSPATPVPAPGSPAGGWQQVLVYLGAFLLAAVSLLLAAGFEIIRLPVLLGSTLVFFVLAKSLWWFFRPASAVFYGLATFYLWADTFALLNAWAPPSEALRFFTLWAATGLVTLLWAIGTWLFRSRFFAVLTATALPLGALWMALALFPPTSTLRFLWAHAFIQAAISVQWAWSWALRKWDPSLASGPAWVARGLSTLHALAFAGLMWLYADEALRRSWTLELALPTTLTWMLLALTGVLGLLLSPIWTWWDLSVLGWSLFFLALTPRAMLDFPPIPRLLTEAGFALVYTGLSIVLARWGPKQTRALSWSLGLAGWLLWMFIAWPRHPIDPILSNSLGLMGLVLMLTWFLLRPHGLTWTLLLLLAVRVYFTGWQALAPDWPSLFQWLLLFLALAPLPPLWMHRQRPTWAISTLVVQGFALMITTLEILARPSSWGGLLTAWLLAGVFWVWALVWPWPYWFPVGLAYWLLGHAQLVEVLNLGGLWPLSVLPYPWLLLALERWAMARRALRWRWVLLGASWVLMFLLSPLLLGAETPVATFTLSLWSLTAAYTLWEVGNPWPGLLVVWLFLGTVGSALGVAEVSDWAPWVSTALGLAALFLFLVFRAYGQAGWGTLWAILGQAGMYLISLGYWLSWELATPGFLLLFTQALAGLGVGLVTRGGGWVWPAVAAVFVSVSILLIAQLAGTGILFVLCLTGLLFLSGGLWLLYRRARRTASVPS